jgi:terminal uridylyltransferase
MQPGVLHRRFLTDLSSSLFSFVLPLLPTNEELTVKEEYVPLTPSRSPRDKLMK